MLDLLNLTVTSCPDHPNPREYFLACETAKQLMNRIDEKFPAETEWARSAQLALLILYNAIQKSKKEQEKEQNR